MKATLGVFPAGAMSMALALAGCAATTHEPRNLDGLKNEIRSYVGSGAYERDVAAVVARASMWLEKRAKRRAPGERLAVVLDLDETLLSSAPSFRELDFGGNDALWDAWTETGTAPAIEPVREFYREARRLGVEVFFVTGRPERQRPATEKNLAAIGCRACAALIMRADDERRQAAVYKAAERRRLSAAGHAIIANIGDQESDLTGGYAEKTFKLPDPFYLTN